MSFTSNIGFSVENNIFEGEIPPELNQATQLRMLVLGDNELTGTIPVELADLQYLEVLE